MVLQAHIEASSVQQVAITMSSAPIPALQVPETHLQESCRHKHKQQLQPPVSRSYYEPQRHRRENSASSAFYSADVDTSSPTFQLILGECGLSDNCHRSPLTDNEDDLLLDEFECYKQPAQLPNDVLDLVLSAVQSIRTQALLASFATMLPPVQNPSNLPSSADKKNLGISGMLRSLSLSTIKDTVSNALLNSNSNSGKRNSKVVPEQSEFLSEQQMTSESMFSEVCADRSDYYKANCCDDGHLFRNMILSMTNGIHQRTSFEPSVFVSAALYLGRIFRNCNSSISSIFRHLCADGEVTFLDEDIAILAFLQGKLLVTSPEGDPAVAALPVWMQQFLVPQQQQKQKQHAKGLQQQTHEIVSKMFARTISLLIGKMYVVCVLLSAKMQEDICYSQWQTRDYWRTVKDLIKNDEQWFPPVPLTLNPSRTPMPTLRKRKSLKDWAQAARLRLSLTSPLLATPTATTVCSSSVGWRPPITFQELIAMEKSLFRSMSFNLYISSSEFCSFVGQHTSCPETTNLLVNQLLRPI